MSARELVVLGTASQAPTRYRSHNGFALRWDDQLVLFDPGEGSQRQCILAGVAVARLTAVCITHFHGDHCLGLPGIIQRRALDSHSTPGGLSPLPVYHPGDGAEYLARMRHLTHFHDTSNIRPEPISASGSLGHVGSLELRAAPLDHRVTAFGFRLSEPDGRRVVPARLAERGITGPDIGRLVDQGTLDTPSGRVTLEQVSVPRKGQSMAFVMDTAPCDGAAELADGVDLLVCESTYLAEHTDLARAYRHMTAAQAGRLAAEAGARRLVLGHFSARYRDDERFAAEAGEHHDDVVVATDLATIPVPARER